VGLLLIVLCLVVSTVPTSADSLPEPSLKIRELNITGDEFVVLQNVGAEAVQLNEFWLGYSSDDTASYIVPTQQLPAVELLAGQSIVLNNGSTSTCDASVVDELGFSSFSNTKGVLALRRLQNDGYTSTFTTVDAVAWGKLPADQIQIVNESNLDAGATAVWYRDPQTTTDSWRVGSFADCSLTLLPSLSDDSSQPPQVISWPQNNASPPSIYVGAVDTNKGNFAHIPVSDRGLKAPQLSEILANPASPQTDSGDEFIELYNPNSKVFDLSGFMLQTASTTSSTTHTYHFPVGTMIGPGGFRAFKSAQTHLSLSNGGGQIWLVDPLGTTLDTCDPYPTAKDGQAWVDASGKWQWTLQPTPGSTNKVATPIASSSTSKTATVNGKKVTAVATRGTSGNTLGASTSAANVAAQPLSIHPLTLAVIILGALLYGAYEYRHDMALKYHQFRRNRNAGR
jgi:hypothetical protein